MLAEEVKKYSYKRSVMSPQPIEVLSNIEELFKTPSTTESQNSPFGRRNFEVFIILPTLGTCWSGLSQQGLVIHDFNTPNRYCIVLKFPGSKAPWLGAWVVDMFCTPMIDVGKEFGIPTYMLFPSNAAFLMELNLSSDTELMFKGLFCYNRMYREAKGITVNTILELEFHALLSYDDKIPPVYTVGPILNPENPTTNNDILQWLEGQPNQDNNEVLPEGFLEHTSGNKKVLGWVLRKSVWYGVPIATWPIYAEQQSDAFQLVNILGLVNLQIDIPTAGFRADVVFDLHKPIIRDHVTGKKE
ncbi:hypothetical protein Tco_1340715 [Tanacetum coccineum]